MTDSKPPILLLAESAITIASLEKMLSPIYQLTVVHDAESAWNAITQMDRQCILLAELTIANDEYGLVERLRKAQDALINAIPVVLLVGAGDEEEARDRVITEGVSDFISMPFSSTELLSRLELQAHRINKFDSQTKASQNKQSPTDILLRLTQQSLFDDRLKQELSFSLRHGVHLSVAILKLDKFQIMEKRFEQVVLTKILNRVAEILYKTIRREDSLCYQGQATFVLLMPATNSLGAITSLHRIKTSFEQQQVSIADTPLPISFSGGIFSSLGSKSVSLEEIYSQLNKKLDKAIESGGDTIISNKLNDDKQSLSIDQALKLIERGKTDDLKLKADLLLRKIMPILQFADENLPIELDETNHYLKIYYDL